MTIKIIGLQAVQEALKQEIDKLKGSEFALVGIQENAGMAEAGSDITMAQLGAILHYGNDHIPARPWLDVGAEKGIREYIETIQEGIEDGLTKEQIMKQVGEIATGYVKEYVTDLRVPPNAPSTIKQKGSDNPLIDTGAMRNSITFLVTNKKPEEGL